jgi:hypothetical protein
MVVNVEKQAIAEWLCHPKLQENHLGVLTGRQSNSKSKTCDEKVALKFI